MNPFFLVMHDPQDDLAPTDLSYVHSVNEGRRRAQKQPIHPENAVFQPQVDEYGIPENPYAQQEPVQTPPVRRSRAARSAEQASQPSFAPQQPAQSQFAAPVSPDIPDWLKIAQQNKSTAYARPQQPRVQAAPRPEQGVRPPVRQQPVSPYEQAGYPPHLLEAQRQLEREQAAVPIRRRHGAQYAQPLPYQPQTPPQPTGASYPPPRQAAPEAPAPMPRAYMHQPKAQPDDGWQVETDEETVSRELPAWIKKVPWLGIAAFAAAAVAVFLWISGMNYEKQTRQIYEDRAAQEAQIVENHPLKYKEILSEKCDKYNLNPAFVAAIMLNESSFRPEATNDSTGARGLMQLVESTAEWVHGKLDDGTAFRFDDMYTPERNAEYGCWYLNYLSGLFRGDPVLVAAAFHAGQGEVRNWLNTAEYSPDGQTVAIEKIPFGDTRRYVGRVMNAYAAYLRIYFGR